jgi:hypothetical protein
MSTLRVCDTSKGNCSNARLPVAPTQVAEAGKKTGRCDRRTRDRIVDRLVHTKRAQRVVLRVPSRGPSSKARDMDVLLAPGLQLSTLLVHEARAQYATCESVLQLVWHGNAPASCVPKCEPSRATHSGLRRERFAKSHLLGMWRS